MKINIEGINKENRTEFKKRMYAISNRINIVVFADNNCAIEVKGDYIITEAYLMEISKIKKDIEQATKDFRVWQFNKN